MIVSSSDESKSLCRMDRKLVRDLTDVAFLLCHDRADRDLRECADCDLALGDLPDSGRTWRVVPGPVSVSTLMVRIASTGIMTFSSSMLISKTPDFGPFGIIRLWV